MSTLYFIGVFMYTAPRVSHFSSSYATMQISSSSLIFPAFQIRAQQASHIGAMKSARPSSGSVKASKAVRISCASRSVPSKRNTLYWMRYALPSRYFATRERTRIDRIVRWMLRTTFPVPNLFIKQTRKCRKIDPRRCPLHAAQHLYIHQMFRLMCTCGKTADGRHRLQFPLIIAVLLEHLALTLDLAADSLPHEPHLLLRTLKDLFLAKQMLKGNPLPAQDTKHTSAEIHIRNRNAFLQQGID
mgnify:CR=1 FL=1